jgi:putative SOS response-associated peptidase YedK
MCARYSLKSSADVLQELFDLDEAPQLVPRYNIAPTQPIAAVTRSPEGRRALKLLQWGLIPSWAKDPAIGQRLINARAETLAEKPAFRSAFKRRRCLIPADGFFEWVEAVDGTIGEDAASKGKVYKQPYFVSMKSGRPFAFAGLWECWETELGGPIESGAIITTEPNDLLARIHNRMPAIIPPEAFDAWLDHDVEPARLLPLLAPYPSEEMRAYPVSRRVGNPRFDSPECIVAITA